jgi:hypothetical protein
MVNEVGGKVDATQPDLKAQFRDFATAVKALATNASLAHNALVGHLVELADTTLAPRGPSGRSLVRAQPQTTQRARRAARAMLAKIRCK